MSIVSEDVDDAPLENYDSSKGSSISSGMQEEYNDLLKYAIVTPKWEMQTNDGPASLPQLRLVGPDNIALSTLENYSEDRSSDGRDSAVGSEGLSSGRKTFRQQAQNDNASLRFMVSTSTRPDRGKGRIPSTKNSSTECHSVDRSESPRVDRSESPRFDYPQSPRVNHAQGRRTDPSAFTASLVTPSLPKPAKPTPEKLFREIYVNHAENGKDSDFGRVKEQLNYWCSKLNNMVLAEMSQSKAVVGEQYRKVLNEQKHEHDAKTRKLQDEMENIKELLHSYETSIARKDSVISNLTRALQTSKDRVEMNKVMVQWKFRLIDQKRQTFTANLAKRYREHALAARAWHAWRSLVEGRWKEKVEKACQRKAKEVCEALISDYEATISSINEALEKSRLEVQKLHDERDKYEEAMKKAFMRGVCALNLEAMTMFQGDGSGAEPQPDMQNISAVVDAISASARDHPPAYEHIKQQHSRQSRSPLTSSHSISSGAYQPAHLQSSSSTSQSITRHSVRSQNGIAVTQNVPAMQDLPKKTHKKPKQANPLNVKVTSATLREATAPSTFNPSVRVKRHHPNIQNYLNQKPLKHVVKYPNTPTKSISGKQ